MKTLLAVLLALPPYHADTEGPDGRRARMATIDRAIDLASEGDRELAAILVTTGYWESRFAQHIHAGQCGPLECDPVKVRGGAVLHLSRTPWQFQRHVMPRGWKWPDVEGLTPAQTERAALVAAAALRRTKAHCGSWVGAVSLYATGRSCSWKGARKRMATFRQVVKDLTP